MNSLIDKFDEILPFLEETYTIGKYYINVSSKSKYHKSNPKNNVIFISHSSNFTIFSHDSLPKDKLFVHYINGLVYADGKFADICDSEGNIIEEVKNTEERLEDIRNFLNTDD